MGMSRSEINMRRLMAKCELLVKDKSKKGDSRLEKYIDSIDEMLIELEKSSDKPNLESMLEYNKRLDKLKGILHSENTNHLQTKRTILTENYTQPDVTEVEKIAAPQTAKYKTMRHELLGITDDENSSKVPPPTGDIDVLLKYHNNMHEKIADEMLTLTRNLKEQTELAGSIIRKDTEIVKKSTVVSENNLSKLHVESDKLTEHSKRAWKCWMWVMIFFVVCVFINMVLFMKVMKKRAA